MRAVRLAHRHVDIAHPQQDLSLLGAVAQSDVDRKGASVELLGLPKVGMRAGIPE
jgi:hypothetical protein